ncbi:hypothetical protein EW146_g2617 [Bondarzewia mesenterica]|uniref:Pseudouridine synthase I TruA alpha/beta domain-containing protein n=1 Tax=Bondarzewia mesenterica TaxID=1095465 RepID=A0A4S4M064_9AGAM|nr:hypothetical protein EW146_g2617 [Bondarzewia mesenterica]
MSTFKNSIKMLPGGWSSIALRPARITLRLHCFPSVVHPRTHPVSRPINLRALMIDAEDVSGHNVPAKRPLEEEVLSNSDPKRAATGSAAPPSRSSPPINPDADIDAQPLSSTIGPSDEGKRRQKNMSRRDAAGYAKSRKGKEEDGKNVGRRRGTRGDGETVGAGQEGEEKGEKAPRLPKRQCACLVSVSFAFMDTFSLQPNVRTIEGVLFDALVKAGAVSQDNADDPVKVNLGRAARTDAGVHAAGNIVSMKLITQVPGVPDIVVRVNEFLPPEIRLWGYVRVQNSFNARLSCDSRKYTYFFPTYLLIPPKPGTGLYNTFHSQSPSSSSSDMPSTNTPADPFWSDPAHAESSKEEDLQRKRRWRASPEMVERLRETVKKFEATHNFHNFTVGRDFSDRSTQRHMRKIEVFEPVVYGETEWISVMFHGQSFMLHQIVRISGVNDVEPHPYTDLPFAAQDDGCPGSFLSHWHSATNYGRGDSESGVKVPFVLKFLPRFPQLYGPRLVFIPKMPSLGLLLEHPIFESYNRKVSSISEKLKPTDAEYRPPIDFDIYQEAIEKFKQEHIYDRMRDIEDRGGVFDAWVRSIDVYSGSDLSYLNPKGIIPASAVIKKNERRTNPFREKKRFDATDYSAAKIDIEQDEEDEAEAEQEGAMDKTKLADMEG